ncbi:uncharacterized protein LODBEIA_P14210 [Lodderomyces beijingensis]|uniref:F-box domain-containing protein n=1 Tax=Lodderomyces beijingensis TaxID=1775926 RepID=A0ABP0ZGA7_9ASCO
MVNGLNTGYCSDSDVILVLNKQFTLTPNFASSNPPASPQTSKSTTRTLYDLPSNILLHICSLLQQYDLANLCISSKVWSFAATSTLYSKIIVNDDITALTALRKVVTRYTKFFGTTISATSFQNLLYSIHSNPSLGRLVKSLILNVNQETLNLISHHVSLVGNIGRSASPSPMISQPSSPKSSSSFTSLASLLDDAEVTHPLRLNSLIAPQIPISFFTSGSWIELSKLTMLSVLISNYGNGTTPFCCPNLQKLKISYHDCPEDAEGLRNFGTMLRTTHSLDNLRELEFTEDREHDRVAMLDILGGLNDVTNPNLPTWLCFFDSITKGCRKMKEPQRRLVLDSLAIEGYVGSRAFECVGLLSNAVDLSLLVNLQLKITETTHAHHAHTDFAYCIDSSHFMYLLTRQTPELVSLAINPTFDCLACQMECITNTIVYNLPHQLRNLSVVFESPNVQASQSLNDVIYQHQHNLQRLLINDKATEVSDRSLLFKCINSRQSWLRLYDYGFIYERLISTLLFSDVWLTDFLKLDEDFIINDQTIQFIEKASGRGLNEYLCYFLHFAFSPVVASNFKLIGHLPKLRNLNVLGLSLVVHDHDGNQEVYYVANGKYISSGLIFKK